MNRLVGEKLSIVTNKAQTTRHRILGIVNNEDSQIVFSDEKISKNFIRFFENILKFEGFSSDF